MHAPRARECMVLFLILEWIKRKTYANNLVKLVVALMGLVKGEWNVHRFSDLDSPRWIPYTGSRHQQSQPHERSYDDKYIASAAENILMFIACHIVEMIIMNVLFHRSFYFIIIFFIHWIDKLHYGSSISQFISPQTFITWAILQRHFIISFIC